MGTNDGSTALLDAQVFAVQDAVVAERLRAMPKQAKAAFEDLMSTDESFRRAVESTTKSVEAVRYRMERLHQVLTRL